jgi:hypothetical protein
VRHPCPSCTHHWMSSLREEVDRARWSERGRGRLVSAPGARCHQRGTKVDGRCNGELKSCDIKVEREEGGWRRSGAVEREDGSKRATEHGEEHHFKKSSWTMPR